MTTTRTTLPDGTIFLGSPLADTSDPDAPIGGIQPTRIGTPLADAAEGTEPDPSRSRPVTPASRWPAGDRRP